MGTPIDFRAGPGKPCPVCGTPSKGCSATADGLHLCRGEPRLGWRRLHPAPDSAGFHHYRPEGGSPRGQRSRKRAHAKGKTPTGSDFRAQAERFARSLTPARSAEFERRLGLPAGAAALLPLLGTCGVWSTGSIFTWPEFEPSGRVAGIMERQPPRADQTRDQQKMQRGGRRGLTLVDGWRERSGPALIVEGASDTLAASAAGLSAVGRPGAGAGTDLLVQLLGDWPGDRGILIVAEPDPAGRDGAERLAGDLVRRMRRPIGVALAPEGAKDTRAWLTHADRGGADWSDRGRAFLSAIEGATTWYRPEANPETVLTTAPPNPAPTGTPPPGASSPNSAPSIPSVLVTTDEMMVADQAIAGLANDPNIYQRSGALCTIATLPAGDDRFLQHPESPRIVELPRATLRERLAHYCCFRRETQREGDSVFQDVHPPAWAVDAVHARGYWPGIRFLEAVLDHPVVRPDGSILDRRGYDPPTRLFVADPPVAVAVPDPSTRDEARRAADTLLETVCDFPFESEEHRSAWLAAVLTPLARFAFRGPAPLTLIDANSPGSGKSLLCRLISLIVTGRDFAVARYNHDPVEMAKVITSIAITGERLILLDNVAGAFGNDALDAALTSTRWQGRILGENRMYDGPLFATWFATGNNVLLTGDIARRVLHVRLNSPLERPDERTDFRHADVKDWAVRNRERLLGAGLTVLRAFMTAGCPSGGLTPMGSFEGWSNLVRGAVVWAGQPDPAKTRVALRGEADGETLAIGCILRHWDQVDPLGTGLTVGQLIEQVFSVFSGDRYAELRDAIETLAPKKDTKTLGFKFRTYCERVIGGKYLSVRKSNGVRRWTVEGTGHSSATRVDGADRVDVHTRGDFEHPRSEVREGGQSRSPVVENIGPIGPIDPDRSGALPGADFGDCEGETGGSIDPSTLSPPKLRFVSDDRPYDLRG